MNRQYIYPVLFCAILCGCLSGHTERAGSVDPSGWDSADTVWIEIANRDTVSSRTLEILLRVDSAFSNDTLPLHITAVAPDGARGYETYTLRPYFTPRKKSSYAEQIFPYRSGVTLPQCGTYMIGISPARAGVKGITAAGLSTVME